MIADSVRRCRYRGRLLWQHVTNVGWQVASASFIRHLLKAHGFPQQEAGRLMRELVPVEAVPNKIISRLVFRGEVIAIRAQTWLGFRYGSKAQVTDWLRHNGFSGDEIRTLFLVADDLPLAAGEVASVRALARHGIRA